MKKKPLKQSWRSWCLYKLAIRDYSAFEITQLILKRARDADQTVDPKPVVDELVEEGLIDDQRYIQSQISLHTSGYSAKGPKEIRRKLADQGGIPSETLDQFIDEQDEKWNQLALEVKNKTLSSYNLNLDTSTPIPEKRYQSLKQKLFRKGFTSDQIRYAMNGLTSFRSPPPPVQSGDISRQVEKQIATGKGPLAIRQSLKQKGIESAVIQEALQQPDEFWISQAISLREKHFGKEKIRTRKERKKQADYLMRKGFLANHIRAVLDD